MTLLRELIEIPEHVQKGDFVLRLSEGVVDPAGTLGAYVVTPELVKCFDQALDFIRDAVARRTSKATYLHGSFGSGKSHFMAVLHLLLQGTTPGCRARSSCWCPTT
jgi:predicted ATPase